MILPIDPLLPHIRNSLEQVPNLVLEAPPGAGKTTRVPSMLLNAPFTNGKKIWVLEPRRLAARMAARRIAEELGESVGESVGYQMRFESCGGPNTRLWFMTEGTLTRKLLTDARLEGVAAIVFDEFHERHLQSDLGLALVKRLQQKLRPDLRIVVMSATLNANVVANFLFNCPILKSEGRCFEVSTEYLPQQDSRHLPLLVAEALQLLIGQGLDGHVLVFLPGARDIRLALDACHPQLHVAQLQGLPLHGELPISDQDRAVLPDKHLKVIFSTNVAETSVTIEGVSAVIDCGLAKISGHSVWSGLPTLKVSKISQASAIQRAGRAGRTQPGRCLRLYTRDDFLRRLPFDVPEILRMDLSDALLVLAAAGISNLEDFQWLDAPPAAALENARRLLIRLGALTEGNELSARGEKMAGLPMHPRQSRVLLEAFEQGILAEGCVLAALLGEREILSERRGQGIQVGNRTGGDVAAGDSDVGMRLMKFEEAVKGGIDPSRIRTAGLDVGVVGAVERARRQLWQLMGGGRHAPPASHRRDVALGRALLAGFPDRIARRKRQGSPGLRAEPSRELIMAEGGNAELDVLSVVKLAEVMVVIEVEEAVDGRGGVPRVRLASAIEPDWLLDMFPEQLQQTEQLEWNEAAGRVDRVERLSFGNLTLDESRIAAQGPEAAALLFRQLRSLGFCCLEDQNPLPLFLDRLRFSSLQRANLQLYIPDDAGMQQLFQKFCAEKSSLKQLREVSTTDLLQSLFPKDVLQEVSRLAPERIRLPGGRMVPVQYPIGQPPFVASRLQDFFGQKESPRIGAGAVPVVIHLLAPNQRAVQITSDLASFWSRHYPAIRKELCRKYPRHAWPEDPLAASPPSSPRSRNP